MSLIAAAAVGGAVGVTHALEADHLAAMATLVGMATTVPTVDSALVFLLASGVLTTLTMTAVATVWGRTLGNGLTRLLKGAAGAIGAVLVAEVTLGLALLP